MKTTLTKCFEGGMFAGLARVNRAKDKKQMLKEIAAEASVGIDMARGLQGRGDWIGSVTKLYGAADAVIQAIDLAETFAGVQMAKTRATVDGVSSYLREADSKVDIEPQTVRPEVKKCELALEGAVMVVDRFADGLNSAVMAKGAMEFAEQDLLTAVYGAGMDKYIGSGVPKKPFSGLHAREDSPAKKITARMEGLGLMTPKGNWEAAPDSPGKQRRWSGQQWEYRDISEAGKPENKSLVDENGAKIEKPEETEVGGEEKPDTTEKALSKSLSFGRFR